MQELPWADPSRGGVSRHLEPLACIRDLSPIDPQDREVLIVVVPNQEIATVRREHHSLGQPTHLDLLDLRHLLALDLQDIDGAVLVVEVRLLAGVRATQDRTRSYGSNLRSCSFSASSSATRVRSKEFSSTSQCEMVLRAVSFA